MGFEKLTSNKHSLLAFIAKHGSLGISANDIDRRRRNKAIELKFLVENGYIGRLVTDADTERHNKQIIDLRKNGIISVGSKPDASGNYAVLDKGAEYLRDSRAISRTGVLLYVRDNWISFLAFIVAAGALVVAIIALQTAL